MKDGRIPGTVLPYSSGTGTFSIFLPMIQAADGLALSQVCAITGLEASTVQNWVKRGFVAHPVGKKYRARQLARILLISALRDAMKIDRIGELMAMVNGSADDEADDIISEEQMYDYLCQAIGLAADGAPSISEIPMLVQRVTEGYTGPTADARHRLNAALEVMVCASIAATYKQEADRIFREMKEEYP